MNKQMEEGERNSNSSKKKKKDKGNEKEISQNSKIVQDSLPN